MIDGDIDSAMVVTSETIYKTKKDGSTVKKQVWVYLDTPNPNITAVKNPPEILDFDDPEDMSSHPETTHTRTYPTQKGRCTLSFKFTDTKRLY